MGKRKLKRGERKLGQGWPKRMCGRRRYCDVMRERGGYGPLCPFCDVLVQLLGPIEQEEKIE